MALRKPLVMVAGQIQQIQSGDTLDASAAEVDVVAMTNDNVSPIVIGAPVYCNGAGTVDLAQADASGTTDPIGLVRDVSIAASASGDIQTDGILSATTSQWDAIAGTTGGLSPGLVYYLGELNPGKLTEVAPTTVGDYVVRVGTALSTTELEISISVPILL